MVASFAATLTTVFLFGLLLLLGGIAQLARALSPGTLDTGWDLFSGFVYTLVGGLLVFDPVSGAVGLTLLLAVFFLVVGALRIGVGMRIRGRGGLGGGGLLLTGGLDLLLGLLIAVGWPEISSWVIGVFLGIELLFTGIALLFLNSALRSVESPG